MKRYGPDKVKSNITSLPLRLAFMHLVPGTFRARLHCEIAKAKAKRIFMLTMNKNAFQHCVALLEFAFYHVSI